MAICTRCPFLLSHLNFAKPLMYFVLKFYPGFPSIYPGSRLTVGISALLVMAVVLYHSLTGQALNDILNLIWLHCLGCSDFFTINKCIEKLLLRSILAFGISLVLFSLLYAGGQKRQALP